MVETLDDIAKVVKDTRIQREEELTRWRGKALKLTEAIKEHKQENPDTDDLDKKLYLALERI